VDKGLFKDMSTDELNEMQEGSYQQLSPPITEIYHDYVFRSTNDSMKLKYPKLGNSSFPEFQ